MKARSTAARFALMALVASGTVGCGGGGGGSGFGTAGMLGKPSTALIAGNLIFVNAAMNEMNESAGYFGMLVDSGSPVVLIDPALFNQPPPTTSAQIPTTVDLGLLDVAGNPVVTIQAIPVLRLSNAMMDTLGFGGILGGDVMREFSVQLDYAAPMMEGFCLGCGPAAGRRADVQSPGGTVPFTLKGGGKSPVTLGTDAQGNPLNSPAITLPPTRIPVTVTIDGVDHPFIVDTGATEVSLRSTVYQELVADGRDQLESGIAIMTIAGASNASLTRAKTITVGDVTIADPPVMTIVTSPPDQLLDSISAELGTPVDGLLGGSFLRNFLVTIDYPHGQLHLEPYVTPPIPDEFRRVGFTLGLDASGARFVVASVYPGTDTGDAAIQNVMVNDVVSTIDGADLDSIGYVAAADQLLDGTPGTTKAITFGRTGDPANAGQTLTVLVQDLIPNPQ